MPRSDEPAPAVEAERGADLAGVPDGFGRLWVPHRMAYIDGENKPVDDAAGPRCAFCRAPTLPDEDGLVVARGTVAYVLLNLYPYNGGHVLVCPYRHVADYTDLTPAEVGEVAELTRTAMRVLRAVSAPAGFNLGMNQGAVAGAGIAAHLHQHVVPRWAGDANFLPVVGRTRALPELLADTRTRLAAAWPHPDPTAPTAPHDETEG
ncbi:MAG TPA: HIT domain-containing protein [Cellulomonas sp.]